MDAYAQETFWEDDVAPKKARQASVRLEQLSSQSPPQTEPRRYAKQFGACALVAAVAVFAGASLLSRQHLVIFGFFMTAGTFVWPVRSWREDVQGQREWELAKQNDKREFQRLLICVLLHELRGAKPLGQNADKNDALSEHIMRMVYARKFERASHLENVEFAERVLCAMRNVIQVRREVEDIRRDFPNKSPTSIPVVVVPPPRPPRRGR